MTRILPFSISRRALLAAPMLMMAGAAASARASEEKKAEAADPSVRLATVGIPVTEGDAVVNYLFLSIRINLAPLAPEAKFRDMEPYFRDAMVRKSHQMSFGQAGHSDRLDEARFKSVMMAEFAKITGPGMIKSIDVLSQNPKRHLG